LVLEEQRLRTKSLIGMEQVKDVFHVPVAVVCIDEHRQVRHGQNVAVRLSEIAHSEQLDIGHTVTNASDCKRADEVRLESGPLD
jgi:hypothetical protein